MRDKAESQMGEWGARVKLICCKHVQNWGWKNVIVVGLVAVEMMVTRCIDKRYRVSTERRLFIARIECTKTFIHFY